MFKLHSTVVAELYIQGTDLLVMLVVLILERYVMYEKIKMLSSI